MFVALDQFGNKLNPIDVDEEELRLLSKSKLIFCPECESLVRFASGEKVTAHFKHVKITDCNYDSEPETEEHLNGKKLIREWLLNQYPQAKVEFEYKITETNQRADVFASFSNGRKIAFEMQCSKIQGSVWKERHALYKTAGIQDIWILGNSVHKYGKTEGEIDCEKHQLVSLASTIYEEDGALFFLDTTNEIIKGLYMHKFIGMHSDTIFLFEEETYPLKDSKVFKKYIGTDSIRRDFGIWYQNKLKEEQWQKEKEEEEKREEARRKIEEEKRIKEEERYFRMLEKRQKQYLVELKTFSLEQVKKKMTRNERNLFEKLIKKHAYNDENFPGIFNVFTNYNYLIKTPSPLWQLLIYDYYIYRKFEPYDKVWIPKIKDMFYKLRQQGVLRFKYRDNDDHFTFAIYDYFNKLNNIGIVIKLGFNNVKYQKILANQLPLHSGKNTHKCVAYYLSFADDVTGLTEELSEIETNFTLYKKMISQNPKLNNENLTSNMEALRSQLEYTNNLLETQSGLGNEWELTFISDMYSLVRRRYLLSQKQREKIESIIKRIEKTLDISLSKNK